jgi:hypothetical protein
MFHHKVHFWCGIIKYIASKQVIEEICAKISPFKENHFDMSKQDALAWNAYRL